MRNEREESTVFATPLESTQHKQAQSSPSKMNIISKPQRYEIDASIVLLNALNLSSKFRLSETGL